MILIAGPYRSGTNDDPKLIEKNVEIMESFALPIFRAGHTPILGEWLALPLVKLGGSKKIGDEVFNEVFHPIATRLLEKCDAGVAFKRFASSLSYARRRSSVAGRSKRNRDCVASAPIILIFQLRL